MVVWLKRLAWGVGALLLLWVMGWLGVPPLLKSQAQTRLTELLGRTVTIGDIGFKPWALDLTLRQLSIAGPAAGSEPLLQLAQLHIDLSAKSIIERAPVIEALELDGLRLRVARTAEGHYDVDDLIRRLAPKPDAAPSEPARFALYNLQLRDAQVRFDDRPVARVHQVEGLHLALPFLSNLPAQVDVNVEPRLAFKLNGTAFDSGAQATPFAQNKAGTLKLTVAPLDLAPYLGYLPASLPVRVARGSVSADLALQFAQPKSGAASVALTGSVGARDMAVTDVAAAPLLAWRQAQLGLHDVQPLVGKLGFGGLRVEGLQLQATRDAAERINLMALAGRAAGKGAAVAAPTAASSPPVASAPSAAPTASTASAAPIRAAPTPWQVTLDTVDVTDARVRWNDAAVTPAVALQIDGLTVGAKQVRWPVAQPIAVSIAGKLRTQADAAPESGSFDVQGVATDHDAKLDVKLTALAFDAFAPYVAQFATPQLAGSASAQAQIDWSGAADAPRLKVLVQSASVDALRLREGTGRAAHDAVALNQFSVGDVQLDLLAHTVQVGQARLKQPQIAVSRAADGRLSVQRWQVPSAHAAAPMRAQSIKTPNTAAQAPWHLKVNDFALEGGQVQWVDELVRHGADPLRAELSGLRVAVQGLEWHGERATPPARVQLAARVGTPRTARDKAVATGVLDYKGQLGLLPLQASGAVRIERFPVHLFAPYVADRLPAQLTRAEAGYKGKVSMRQHAAGIDASAAGDVLLADVLINALSAQKAGSLGGGDELLSWQSFALKGVTFAMKPGTKPQVEIGEAALSDFYSRLIITEQGKFNLQDVAAPAGAASAAAGSVVVAPPASAPITVAVVAAPPPASGASAAAAAPPDLPIDIKVGATRLTNGRVDFSDRFVRPNYSAALTELNGQLGPFSSGSRDMATLALRGRAAGTALLEISGQLNPTAKPLALDIQAKATDLELAPLSPYAGKYAGYAIERGKLSMEISYKIDPDGKLDAKNQVVLNQLTFGDKIDSPDATKLPVLLAVALLKDRNGVIDINLPVSGSINDPKFSIGGIIVKVIVNILTKAFTAPFALLAGGGSDDLSLVEFVPGTARLATTGSAAVDKVAKALTDRPALKMTVTGAADPVSEREAYQQAAVDARLLAEQRREAQRAGVAPSPASAASGGAGTSAAPLGADERLRLLKVVYKQTDMPDKPRNAIGFAKDIPAPEMEALLKRHLLVTAEAMRELALQRGIAVRDALIAKGLPSERLFLAAPKLRASGEEDATWTPRVQLALTTN